jgi:hypothetical protein
VFSVVALATLILVEQMPAPHCSYGDRPTTCRNRSAGLRIRVRSCGAWTTARKGSPWYYDGQWILGYVSAVNVYAPKPARQTNSDAILGWIDNYCQVNPLKQISDAAAGVAFELEARW